MNAKSTRHETDKTVSHRDPEGARLGMWLFLFTEVMLFGGLFILYSVYRYRFGMDFETGSRHLGVLHGTINTMILLTSSLSLVLSIEYFRKRRRLTSALFSGGTILLGGVFLGIKALEWSELIREGIFPGSPLLVKEGSGRTLFFGLYYMMTGLHGIHVIIGMLVLSFFCFSIATGRLGTDRMTSLENGGLYWHLVDIIWIFLFPLFYLV